MELGVFNAMEPSEAAAVVSPCADIGSWVDAVVSSRPYADVPALLRRADELAADWTGADVERALADHPRIGERPVGDSASAGMSSREQAGVDPADADVAERLAAGNRLYEERFDRIFLVRAAGRSAEEMLAQLQERLAHDPATELEATTGQLREIALLRLAGCFA